MNPSAGHASSLIGTGAQAGPNNPLEPSSEAACGCALNTYSITAQDVAVDATMSANVAAGSSREGTTRIRVKLDTSSLPSAMSVVTASRTGGLVHQLADAWRFFKNYALIDSLVSVINPSAGNTLFPRAAVALQASSLLTAGQATSVSAYVSCAERSGKRELWTHSAPTNVLLLIPGHPVAAIADIMAAELDDDTESTVTLTLDVVHQPKLVSELDNHTKQTLDDSAHYHFFTPEGVSVDAAAFLQAVKAAGNRLPALGNPCMRQTSARNTCNGYCDAKDDCVCPCNEPPNANDACTIPSAANQSCTTGRCVIVGDGVPVLTCVCDPPTCVAGETCRVACGGCDVADVCDANGECPEEDQVKPAGTVCSEGHGQCVHESTCDGITKECQKTYKANGAPCYYDATEEHFFYPFANRGADASVNAAASSSSQYGGRGGSDEYDDDGAGRGEEYERDPYGDRWPLCRGSCQAGRCVMDKRTAGCCYMHSSGGGGGGGGDGYAHSQSVNAAETAYARENLVCWR